MSENKIQSITKENRIFYILLAIASGFCVWRPRDSDIYFILNQGRYILNHGLFVSEEPFTMHKGFDFRFEKWASDILYYVLYSHGGFFTMWIFVCLMGLLFGYIFYKMCMYYTKGDVASSCLSVCIAMIFMKNFLTFRPQTITFVFLAIELFILERNARGDAKSYEMCLLPVIAMLDTWFHSTIWVILLMMAGPYLFDIRLDENKNIDKSPELSKRRKKVLLSMVAMTFATMIGPFGYHSTFHVFPSYFHVGTNKVIAECLPLSLNNIVALYAFVSVGFVFVYVWRTRMLLPLRHLLLYVGFFVFGCLSQRNMPYFILVSIPLVAMGLKELHIPDRVKSGGADRLTITVFAVMIGIVVCLYYSTRELEYMSSVDYVADHYTKGETVYTSIEDGGYAEWKGLTTYFDGRVEVFFKSVNHKKDIMNEWCAMDVGILDPSEILEQYKFDWVTVMPDDAMFWHVANSDNYEFAFKNEKQTWFVFRRKT